MSDFLLPTETLQVQPGASLPTQVPAFGAQIGSAIGQLGEVQTRIYRDHNAVASLAAQNQLNEWTTEALYHPKNGVMHQESGVDAPKVVDKTLSEYEAKRSQIASALPNDDARNSFNMAADEHANNVRKQLYGYEHAQVTESANRESAAYVKNLQDSAVQHLMVQGPSSEAQARESRDAVQDDIAKQKAAIADACQRNGIGAEACTLQQNDAASKTQLSVITQLFSSGQNATGKQWFEEHKDQLQGEDLIHATRMVRIGTDQDQARSISDDILGQVKAEATNADGVVDPLKLNLETALQKLDDRKVPDAGIYKQAQDNVVHMFRLAQEAHREQQGNVLTAVGEILGDESNTSHDVPADKLALLDFANRKKVDERIAQLKKGVPIETNVTAWGDFMDRAKDPARWDELLQRPASEYAIDFSKTDAKRAESIYADVAGKVSRRDTTLSQGMWTEKVGAQVLTENGLDVPKEVVASGQQHSPKYVAAMKRQQLFTDQLHKLVGAEQLKLKRELIPGEIEDQARKLLVNTTWDVVPPSAERRTGARNLEAVWGRRQASGAFFESPGASRLAAGIRDIPIADRTRLADAAKEHGAVVTEAHIIEAYNREVTDQALLEASRANR